MSAIIRKPRKYPIILETSSQFSNALHHKNYDLAARIVVSTSLRTLGTKGLINALDEAISYLDRKQDRRGL